MLTTTQRNSLSVEVIDSQFTIAAGVSQAGTDIIDHQGSVTSFSDIVAFSGADQYAYSLVYLEKSGNSSIVDSTQSPVADGLEDLVTPDLPSNRTPVALFTFASGDSSSDVSLVSLQEIRR